MLERIFKKINLRYLNLSKFEKEIYDYTKAHLEKIIKFSNNTLKSIQIETDNSQFI